MVLQSFMNYWGQGEVKDPRHGRPPLIQRDGIEIPLIKAVRRDMVFLTVFDKIKMLVCSY